MFSFLRSASARRREESRDLLRHAAKVIRYRGDIIPPRSLTEINEATERLRTLVADKSVPPETLEPARNELDALLRRDGGKIYPVGVVADWTETFIIAAILAGGVRAYVFQPFKIPTNSMYPTYHGMTSKVYAADEPEPGFTRKLADKVTLGAAHHAPLAPVDGEVLIPLLLNRDFEVEASPKERETALDSGLFGTGLLKGPADVHTLIVGGQPVKIVTPTDFSFKDTLLEAYFPEQAKLPVPQQDRWKAVVKEADAAGKLIRSNDPRYSAFLKTGRTVKAGEPILRFDVLTGDMVFVDRMSYHFVKPKVGDAFVFRTSLVPGMRNPDGSMPDNFYIKRLAGGPGDTLRVENGQLIRNGAPASGTPGFDFNNAKRLDLKYFGYTPDIGGHFSMYKDHTLPAARYWALGDNSANSSDSRAFGAVPEEALVGRALFIVHPFGSRWGVAQ